MSQNLPPITPELLLDAVPVANQAARIEQRGEAIVVFLPIEQKWWMKPPFSWALNFRRERGVLLDSLGREIFESCDGQTTVESMIDAFAQRHRVRFHDARLSVLQFLRSLVQRRVVALVLPEVDDDQVRRHERGPRAGRKVRQRRRARFARRKEALA